MPPTEVDDLVIQLKAGALAVPLEVIQSRTVGPTLGQDSIDQQPPRRRRSGSASSASS